jgi:hypothetical protein
VGTITSDDAPPPGEEPPPPPGEEPPPPPPGEDQPPPPGEDQPPPPGEDQPPPPGEDPPPAPEANQAPDCSSVAPSTARLWSPDHKFRLVYLDGASDPDGDALEYEIASVTQDEPVGRGPDAKHGERGLWLRAERLGQGDGRVYRIAYTARDDHGNSCGGLELVTVPHDRRHAQAADSGGAWDSFGS